LSAMTMAAAKVAVPGTPGSVPEALGDRLLVDIVPERRTYLAGRVAGRASRLERRSFCKDDTNISSNETAGVAQFEQLYLHLALLFVLTVDLKDGFLPFPA
jgi:hypothetical protein